MGDSDHDSFRQIPQPGGYSNKFGTSGGGTSSKMDVEGNRQVATPEQ